MVAYLIDIVTVLTKFYPKPENLLAKTIASVRPGMTARRVSGANLCVEVPQLIQEFSDVSVANQRGCTGCDGPG
jgi:hypothetical protein